MDLNGRKNRSGSENGTKKTCLHSHLNFEKAGFLSSDTVDFGIPRTSSRISAGRSNLRLNISVDQIPLVFNIECLLFLYFDWTLDRNSSYYSGDLDIRLPPPLQAS